jgi:hypothetical protein
MKKTIEVKTFQAQIWMGFKEGYDGPVHTMEELKGICKEYVDNVKLCVTLNPTGFIYVNGDEPGAMIGLIQYPRFVITEKEIKEKAIELARIIMVAFKQFRCTVVTNDKTYLLENEHLDGVL